MQLFEVTILELNAKLFGVYFNDIDYFNDRNDMIILMIEMHVVYNICLTTIETEIGIRMDRFNDIIQNKTE